MLGKQEFETGPHWLWAFMVPWVLLGLPVGLSPALPHSVCLFPSLFVPVLPSFSLSLSVSVSLRTSLSLSVPAFHCVSPRLSLSPLFSVLGFFCFVLFYFLVSIALCFSLCFFLIQFLCPLLPFLSFLEAPLASLNHRARMERKPELCSRPHWAPRGCLAKCQGQEMEAGDPKSSVKGWLEPLPGELDGAVDRLWDGYSVNVGFHFYHSFPS